MLLVKNSLMTSGNTEAIQIYFPIHWDEDWWNVKDDWNKVRINMRVKIKMLWKNC